MLEITVWNVNHGSASYIKTPNNRHIAVDLGDDGDQFSPLLTLSRRGIKQLDAVVITHPHRDHMDDISNFPLLAPLSFWRPRHLSEADIRKGNRAVDKEVVSSYLEINADCTGVLTPATDITVPASFGGAAFQVFSPHSCDTGNLNNHSLVVVLSYARLKMVIPGDNEAASWKELLQDPVFVTAVKGTDVFLASHHGRDAGYCAELFEAMGKPRLVVISDGRFGDTSATGRYSSQARGWTIYNEIGSSAPRNCVTTRKDGHITIKFGWKSNNPQDGNFLAVTTSNPDLLSSAAESLLGGRF